MIDRWLNQAATLYRKSGVDAYGQATFAAGVAVKCRWQAKVKLLQDREGKEVSAQAEVWLLEELTPEDELEYGGVRRVVLAVEEAVDLGGNVRFRKAWV